MNYDYVFGIVEFIVDLCWYGVKIVLVISFNMVKMENVYYVYFEFKFFFDEILIVECFKCFKFDFECFLLGMIIFGFDLKDLYVFEDLFYGL